MKKLFVFLTMFLALAALLKVQAQVSVNLPLTQDFENGLDASWTTINSSGDNTLGITLNEGNNCFQFSSFNSSSDYTQYLITPELPTYTTKYFAFDYKNTNPYNETFEVGYSTTTNDVSAFTWSGAITTNSTTWTEYIKNGIPADVKYIAIKYESSYQYYLLIDNIVVDEANTCMHPSNLVVDNIAGASARVSWTPAEGLSGTENYYVEYAEQGNLSWSAETTTGNSLIISSLQPQTTYNVRLYMQCSDGNSDTVTTSFTTKCLVGGDVAIGNGTGETNNMPTNSCYNYSFTQQVYSAIELGGANTFHSIAFDCTYPTANPTRTLSVYLMHTSQSNPASWLPMQDAQLVFTGDVNFTNGWNTLNFSTNFNYNGTDNLAVLVHDHTGNYNCSNTFAVFESTIPTITFSSDGDNPTLTTISSFSATPVYERPNIIFGGDCDSTATCMAPNVFVESIGEDEVTINWAPGYQESNWDIEYKEFSDADWTYEGNVSSAPYTITNLAANTQYLVRFLYK